jgi:hypothetical protein
VIFSELTLRKRFHDISNAVTAGILYSVSPCSVVNTFRFKIAFPTADIFCVGLLLIFVVYTQAYPSNGECSDERDEYVRGLAPLLYVEVE